LNRLSVQNGMSVTYFGPFLRALQRKEGGKEGGREGDSYFVQDGAIAHTANCFKQGVCRQTDESQIVAFKVSL
jgi:hypothetical protein